MAKRHKVVPGMVVAIPVADEEEPSPDGRYRIAQVWAMTKDKYLVLIAVYGEWTGEVVLKEPPMLLSLTNKYSITDGRWKQVGWSEPPPSSRFPVYQGIDGIIPTVVTIDWSNGPRRIVSPRNYKKLPPPSHVTPPVIEWAIRSKLGLQEWSPYISLVELEPQAGFTQGDWF